MNLEHEESLELQELQLRGASKDLLVLKDLAVKLARKVLQDCLDHLGSEDSQEQTDSQEAQDPEATKDPRVSRVHQDPLVNPAHPDSEASLEKRELQAKGVRMDNLDLRVSLDPVDNLDSVERSDLLELMGSQAKLGPPDPLDLEERLVQEDKMEPLANLETGTYRVAVALGLSNGRHHVSAQCFLRSVVYACLLQRLRALKRQKLENFSIFEKPSSFRRQKTRFC